MYVLYTVPVETTYSRENRFQVVSLGQIPRKQDVGSYFLRIPVHGIFHHTPSKLKSSFCRLPLENIACKVWLVFFV